MNESDDAPYHAHVYSSRDQRDAADELRGKFQDQAFILFVGRMTEGKVGPHPIPQYEVHFRRDALAEVQAMIRASGLRALVHPLTDDDLADHTRLGEWFGEPLDLDLKTLDPPGINQGVPRFGKTDF